MACVSAALGTCTPAIMSTISSPMLPRPVMRSTMRSTIFGQRRASCIAGLGTLWHCTQ
jgi:hypothetical protein